MYRDLKVALVIPALNEQESIGGVLDEIDHGVVDVVIVADNGSRDDTAERALAGGARVVHEQRQGYGSACLRGIEMAEGADIIVFMDGDGSDDGGQISELLAALLDRELDLVIASRIIGEAEPGALSPLQRFGSWLTSSLVWAFWRVRYTDLGPFRAIRREALDRLNMADPDFGWTVEMQVKAAQRGMRVGEIPANYRRRAAGDSKVSGTIFGSYRAGKRILGYVLAAKLRELGPGR